MYYKTSWNERLQNEKIKWKEKYPEYKLIVSSSERWKPFTTNEVELLKNLKRNGISIKEIANEMDRSYWSIVAK